MGSARRLRELRHELHRRSNRAICLQQLLAHVGVLIGRPSSHSGPIVHCYSPARYFLAGCSYARRGVRMTCVSLSEGIVCARVVYDRRLTLARRRALFVEKGEALREQLVSDKCLASGLRGLFLLFLLLLSSLASSLTYSFPLHRYLTSLFLPAIPAYTRAGQLYPSQHGYF